MTFSVPTFAKMLASFIVAMAWASLSTAASLCDIEGGLLEVDEGDSCLLQDVSLEFETVHVRGTLQIAGTVELIANNIIVAPSGRIDGDGGGFPAGGRSADCAFDATEAPWWPTLTSLPCGASFSVALD